MNPSLPNRRLARLVPASVLTVLTLLGLTLTPNSVSAESGDLNLHLEFGGGLPIAGHLSPPPDDGASRTLMQGWLSLDWQFSRPWAVEFIVGIGTQFEHSEDIRARDDSAWQVGLGARWRPLDDAEGYATEAQGNVWGNLWLSAHLNYEYLDGDVQFGPDIAIGYEFSIARPLSIGIFARTALLFEGQIDDVDVPFWAGISASVVLAGDNAPIDSDGDGLNDDREELLGLDANNPDSDGDGLSDLIEVEGPTDPSDRDSDNDGLDDGEEDANHNGLKDPDETDPSDADTDDGGVNDGAERNSGTNPLQADDDRIDEDRDGVGDREDDCLETPSGAEVNERGCEVMGASMSLEGVQFRTGRADILPASTTTLNRAIRVLQNNPNVRVEVGGHTDNRGSRGGNQRLSRARAEAVRRWLIERGIGAGRLISRGYGPSEPVADNNTEEGRARNRRIEFRRID